MMQIHQECPQWILELQTRWHKLTIFNSTLGLYNYFCIMRLTVIIFAFLFGILSFAPNMQGGQFFKISEVVEHYNGHQNSKEGFKSVLAFIQDHYFDNNNSKENKHNLPFKSVVSSVLVMHVQNIAIIPVVEKIEILAIHSHCFGEPNNQNFSKLFSIWNPPQMA